MLVRVENGVIDVVNGDVLTALEVTTSLSAEAAVDALIADGLARPHEAPGVHAWLDVEELARRAAPAGDEAWPDAFEAMVDYAAGRGWTSADRSLVRAHVAVDP